MVREKSNKTRLNNKKKQKDAPPKQIIPKVVPGDEERLRIVVGYDTPSPKVF